MANPPPAGNSTTTKNVVVKVTVEGDVRAVNALANLERAQAQLARAQNAASRGTRAMRSDTDQATRSQRQNTQASIQAGQQIQDFAIQLQGGQNILVAFTQQSAQLAFVLSGLEGRAGAVARFFTGPWGTAIFLAVAVLTPLINALWESGDAAEKAEDKNKRYQDVLADYGSSFDDVREAVEQYLKAKEIELRTENEWIALTQKTIEKNIQRARSELVVAAAIVAKTEAAIQSERRSPASISVAGLGGSSATLGVFNAGLSAAEAEVKLLKDTIANLQETLADTTNGIYAQVAGLEDHEKAAKKDAVTLTRYQEVLKSINETYTAYSANATAAAMLNQQFREGKITADVFYRGLKILHDELRDLNSEAEGIKDALDPARKLAEEIANINYQLALKNITESEARRAKDNARQAAIAQRYANSTVPDFGNTKLVTLDMKELQIQLEKVSDAHFAAAQNVAAFHAALTDVAVDGIKTVGEELSAAVEGAQSFGEAFEAMGKTILRTLSELAVKWAIMQVILAFIPGGAGSGFGQQLSAGLGFAKGGAFQNGIQTFASGGIVTQPTIFPMAKGIGLMGEAGAEAIMPLTRGPDGKLGVQGSGTNITVINNAGAAVSVEDKGAGEIAIIIEQTKRAVAADIARGDGTVSRSLQGTYGLSRHRR